MKKMMAALFLLAAVSTQVKAQNFQVHYDFGKGREYVTTTLELFKVDKWGNTFAFIDYDFNYGDKKSPALSYMEFARCLNFWGGPFSAQIEYNGGLIGRATTTNFAGESYAINNAWLVGVDYFMHNADFSKTLNLKVLAKDIIGKNYTPQFTAVWGIQLLDKKVTLCGFADLWWEKGTYTASGDDANPVFITEPQFWYNFTSNFSAGSEVEIASNFGGIKGFKVCPTLAVKWNF